MALCRAVTAMAALWALATPALGTDAPLPGDGIFGLGRVVRIGLTMTPGEFAALAPRGGPAPGGPRSAATTSGDDAHRNTFGTELPWSRGAVAVDGVAFADVGIRAKGNGTLLYTARALRKSLKLDFDRHVPGQRLDGLSMVNLHCGVTDATRTRESLAYAFFRAAGVPAPRTALAEVSLTVPGRYDGEFVGAYTLVEQVNKAFLRRWFGDDDGLLLKPEGLVGGPAWLGDDWAPWAARYRPEREPTEKQRRRLMDFAALVEKADDAGFAARIGEFLDVDAFLRFIAANALVANLDSYLAYGHNYYLYLVPATDRFVFIPWDLDLSLATWPAAGTPEQLVELSIEHPHAGADRLLDRLLAIPAHAARYREIVADLLATSFTAERLRADLDVLEDALREPLALESLAVVARGEEGAGGMAGGRFGGSLPPRAFVERRIASVRDQLAGRSRGFVPRPLPAPFGGAAARR